MLAFAGQGVVLVFFVAIYIAYLSLLAFVLTRRDPRAWPA